MCNLRIRILLPLLLFILPSLFFYPQMAVGQDLSNKNELGIISKEGSLENPSKRLPNEIQDNLDSKPLWPSDDESDHLDVGQASDSNGSVQDDALKNQAEAAQKLEITPESPKNSASKSPSSLAESDDEWKLDLAKKEYARDPKDLSLSELLSAYAELINSDCFANQKPSCGRLIDESLKLDPFFTPAICALHSFKSKLCIQSYGSLRLGLIEDKETSISRQLTLSLDENRQAEALKTMQQQRWNLMQQFNQNQTQEGLSGILRMFFKELALVCNREQFFVETTKNPDKAPVNPDDALTTLLLATPTPTPIPGGFIRSRRITKACLDLADEALSFAPDFSSAVCAKFGRYSPRCNQSLQNAQIKKPPLNGDTSTASRDNREGTATTNEGLEEF